MTRPHRGRGLRLKALSIHEPKRRRAGPHSQETASCSCGHRALRVSAPPHTVWCAEPEVNREAHWGYIGAAFRCRMRFEARDTGISNS